MRIWSGADSPKPSVDELTFRSLYRKSEHLVRTADGWTLALTRYQPVRQAFDQPLWAEPLLLVHGFSQNRHAWTCGEFVKNLLFFGVDVHIVELRGHGKSSLAFQREGVRISGGPLPQDLDYGWDIDSYFLYDLPAAIEAVKELTGRPRIFYCGHSMGGILGYGLAGQRDDLEGLVTIGAPADMGHDFWLLKALALGFPVFSSGVDVLCEVDNLCRQAAHRGRGAWSRMRSFVSRRAAQERAAIGPTRRRFRYAPVDAWLKWAERRVDEREGETSYGTFPGGLGWLSNPSRVAVEDIRWLLRQGGEREPRAVVEQFARWIRRGELCCYRTGYDFKRGFSSIRIPMAVIFGDLDPLATAASTRRIYLEARSEYLVWRPVKGNSHIELTIGRDVRPICYDIKSLIEYARTHRLPPGAVPGAPASVP